MTDFVIQELIPDTDRDVFVDLMNLLAQVDSLPELPYDGPRSIRSPELNRILLRLM